MVPEHLPVSHVLSSSVAISRISAMIALRSRPSDGSPRSTGKRSAYGYADMARLSGSGSAVEGRGDVPQGVERGDELGLEQVVDLAVLGALLHDGDRVDHAGEVVVVEHAAAVQRVERGGPGDRLVRVAQRRDRPAEDVGERLHPLPGAGG